ncbi:hypothetical protein CRD60_00475 [Bifidobacterium aemilianum]|uniref:Uncharacterized protein n=2 Tax=Bifidobacterium aemilianum TaxID=2493120 RepID=A0A366K9G2_9BIFI|nr:hypothetical protein CRD60_00475 [Bifidobacterium aemilianum]
MSFLSKFAHQERSLTGPCGGARQESGSLPAPGSPQPAGSAKPGALNQEEARVFDQLLIDCVKLGPVTKRRSFEDLGGVPEGWTLGWAQLPQSQGQAFSLGFFPGKDLFCQIALSDRHGRVFPGKDPDMDTHGMEPVFMFSKEGSLTLADDERLRRHDRPEHVAADLRGLGRSLMGQHQGRIRVIHGGVVGRDETGQMTWLASWLKHNNRYTLEQTRALLPEYLRVDLPYRDAISIAFFATHFLPSLQDLQIGFGAGNIFRRLNREAPMGAIRRSVRDSAEARATNMRVSGLEDYFADLMSQAGALGTTPGLEAVHGAEPLHLYTSSYSGCYFFTWGDSLEFGPALTSLNIEGSLNRFAAISALLEHNARMGANPTEDTVSRVQAAQIDMALLENPALLALKPDEGENLDLHDRGGRSLSRIMAASADTARMLAQEAPGPAAADPAAAQSSEWVYRQTLAQVLRRLRLPFRFDVEYRSNLAQGKVALGYTASGSSMMPASRYDQVRHEWTDMTQTERAAMSTRYNLRMGLIMAALAFGASPQIDQVSLHMDSMGLEEAVAEQDSAISQLMSQALRAFEHMRSPDVGLGRSKADPKDGDIHGDPTKATPSVPEARGESDLPGTGMEASSGLDAIADPGIPASLDGVAEGRQESQGTNQETRPRPEPGHTHEQGEEASGEQGSEPAAGQGKEGADNQSQGIESQGDAGQGESVDQQFKDLMAGVDFDQVAFSLPEGEQSAGSQAFSVFSTGAVGKDGDRGMTEDRDDTDEALAPLEGLDGDDGDQDGRQQHDPLSFLHKSPTVRTLMTVRIDRRSFMELVEEMGLTDPIAFYQRLGATIRVGQSGGLEAVKAEFDLRDADFSPAGSQEEPELSDTAFTPEVARLLGTQQARGLSIQREDLLQNAVDSFHQLAADQSMPSVSKAQQAMDIVEGIGDPELRELAPQVSSALIDGQDTPNLSFSLAKNLDEQRIKARDLLFSGQVSAAITGLRSALQSLDQMYAKAPGVPRYFNSYAERVVYNRLFATDDESTLLIPDNLFYAHMELADVLAQFQGVEAALPELNALVSYAPAYPQSHMKLAVQLARKEDWDSARAACLNALRVALDRDDAAYAYYRLAYAEWMRDEFALAVAAYRMSEHIAPGQIASLAPELQELMARAKSQCLPVPMDVEEASELLASRDLPVWPNTEVADIVSDAARVCVDHAMFVPARTLAVASVRMNDSSSDGIDMAQAQFIRSLNA